jgi:hypothetical protein
VREMKDEKRKTHACNNNHDSKRFKKINKKKREMKRKKKQNVRCALAA